MKKHLYEDLSTRIICWRRHGRVGIRRQCTHCRIIPNGRAYRNKLLTMVTMVSMGGWDGRVAYFFTLDKCFQRSLALKINRDYGSVKCETLETVFHFQVKKKKLVQNVCVCVYACVSFVNDVDDTMCTLHTAH